MDASLIIPLVIIYLVLMMIMVPDAMTELAVGLVVFVAKCIGLAIAFVAVASIKVSLWMAIRLWRGIVLGAEFLIILADEAIRSGGSETGAGDHDGGATYGVGDDDEVDDDADDPYAQALALIGLAPGFTQDELRRRYWALMKRAHPDTPGGSQEAAQKLNEAYEIVRREHG